MSPHDPAKDTVLGWVKANSRKLDDIRGDVSELKTSVAVHSEKLRTLEKSDVNQIAHNTHWTRYLINLLLVTIGSSVGILAAHMLGKL